MVAELFGWDFGKTENSMRRLIDLRIVNVVASTQLSQSIQLDEISLALPNCSFDPEVFAGLVYRRADPRSSMILFGNGKLVSTGTNSTGLARLSLRKTLEDIQRIESRVLTLGKIRIVNMVAVADYGEPLRLGELQLSVPGSSYDPETFPGLFMPKQDGSVLLVFASGKVVCTGAKSKIEALSRIEGVGHDLAILGYLAGRPRKFPRR
jgi:transcription initiation factor TFIID TATA-box-binding protein